MRAASIVLALLLATAFASAQEKTVTYQSDGAPAKKVLAELSAKTKLNLQTNPQTENETLFIQVKDAPVDKFLEKIAWAIGGSWRKEDGAQILQRTDSDRLDLRRIERQHEIENYQAGIDLVRKQIDPKVRFDSAAANKMAADLSAQVASFDPESTRSNFYQNVSNMQKRGPIGRAFNRIVSQFTAAELADLPTNLRTVYSTHPTRMQRPFGKDALAALAQFQREQNIWVEAVRLANVKAPTFNGTTYGVDGIPDPEGGPVAKVLVTASKMSVVQGIVMLEMKAVDSKGRSVGRLSSTIAPIDVENIAEKPTGGEATIEVDPETQAILSAAMRSQGKAIDPAFLAKLLDPEKYDPVALMGSPILKGYAKAKKANFVVNAPDFLMLLSSLGAQAKIPVRMVDTMRKIMCDVNEEDGWITWRPTAMLEAQKSRADRRLLGQYLKRLAQPNSLSFEERAYWAYRLPMDDMMSPVVSTLRRIVRLAVTEGLEQDYYDTRFLKLYGSMTAEQRARARGGGFPLASLTQEQLAMVMELVYGLNSNLDYQPTEAGMLLSELQREPTEALPDGIPQKSFLTIEESADDVVFVNYTWQGGAGSNNQACSASELAWYKHSSSRPDLYPWASNQTYDFNKLLYGKRIQINFKLHFTEAITQTFQSQERQYGGNATNIEGLPADFLKAYQEQLRQYEESAKNQKPGEFGNVPVQHKAPPPLR